MLEQKAPEPVGCWPENWPVLQVLDLMRTQWNVVQGGVIGLRYESLPVVLRMLGIPKKSRAALLHGLRVMEDEVLTLFRENG